MDCHGFSQRFFNTTRWCVLFCVLCAGTATKHETLHPIGLYHGFSPQIHVVLSTRPDGSCCTRVLCAGTATKPCALAEESRMDKRGNVYSPSPFREQPRRREKVCMARHFLSRQERTDHGPSSRMHMESAERIRTFGGNMTY